MTRRRTGVSATTVADLGPPSRMLISPKNSPGRSGTRLSADTSARAVPSMIRKNSSPGSPAPARTVPAATSKTRAILATLRSCFWLQPSKIGTSLSRSILSSCLAPGPDVTGSSRPSGSGNRAIHHSGDEFHGNPPARLALCYPRPETQRALPLSTRQTITRSPDPPVLGADPSYLPSFQGQREGECGALADLTRDPDPAPVHLDEFLRQREPEPRALHLPSLVATHLAELLEDRLLVLRRDPDAGVADRDLDHPVGKPGLYPTPPPF